MQEETLLYYFRHFSRSLQTVTFQRTGHFYHKNDGTPADAIYLCPLCLNEKVGLVGSMLHGNLDFTLDHFPPKSVGGKRTVLVCKKCNDESGKNFDYSLKDWILDQSAVHWTPGTKIPIRLRLENTKGSYKGNLIIKGPNAFDYDLGRYPLVDQWMKKIAEGHTGVQTILLNSPDMEHVYKALLKAAYLYGFSVWGYDFVFSETARHFRNILFGSDKHVISNWGIFFHVRTELPPEGLCYVFEPLALQAFMINLPLIAPTVEFSCMISVLIPGADSSSWQALKAYESIIQRKATFNQAFIQLPDQHLFDSDYFPYTRTWQIRSQLRIAGVTA